jgi:copper chaperone NosL
MALMFGLLVIACKPKSDTESPPEIVLGQDLCDQCGMIISEARFAAGTLLTNGEYRKFDDIQEMLVYHMEHPADQVKAWFVHDYDSEDWIRGEEAFFVRSQQIKTPMDGGIVAFLSQERAGIFAAEWEGRVYSLDEVRAEVHMEVHGN